MKGSEKSAPHLAVTGAVPVILAAALRAQEGKAPLAPDAGSGHVADFLRMLTGETPVPAREEALTTYLVTVMDHGMNASTFTARVIASTQAGIDWAALGAHRPASRRRARARSQYARCDRHAGAGGKLDRGGPWQRRTADGFRPPHL
jgi:hypothetical protein